MPKTERLPEIIVFAGPNGSGKSTVTRIAKVVQPYTNTLAFQLRTRVDLSLKEKGNLSMCRIRSGLTNQRWKGVITVLVQTVLWSPQQHSI